MRASAPVASLSDIPPGTLRSVTLSSGTRVCLANIDGEIVALRDVCSHQAFPLSEGTLFPGGVLECAWHGARFDCRTGVPVSPPAEEPVERFEVEVQNGMIFVHERTP
jgi:3-phenylpropionate/trans-cinnamate dioxygenase ferredoxin subunit